MSFLFQGDRGLLGPKGERVRDIKNVDCLGDVGCKKLEGLYECQLAAGHGSKIMSMSGQIRDINEKNYVFRHLGPLLFSYQVEEGAV